MDADVKAITAFFNADYSRKKAKLEQNVAYNEQSIKQIEDAIPVEKSRYEGRLASWAAQKVAHEEMIVKEKLRLEKLKESEDKETKKAQARAMVDAQRLKRHKGVQSIEIRGTNVIVTTPLLWVNIRKDAGSRETERTCIGAYKFTIDYARRRVIVDNLLFDRHWAVNAGNPCFGEYEQEIIRLMGQGRLYEVWDMLYQWLIGADRDASAYMPSHIWKRDYRRPQRNSDRLPIGSFVVVTGDYDNVGVKGYTAIIAEYGNGVSRLIFKGRPRYVDGSGFWVSNTLLFPISQKKFKEADRYTVTVAGDMLKKLDAMKSGTVEDYQKLASRRSRVTLAPYTV